MPKKTPDTEPESEVLRAVRAAEAAALVELDGEAEPEGAQGLAGKRAGAVVFSPNVPPPAWVVTEHPGSCGVEVIAGSGIRCTLAAQHVGQHENRS